MQYKFRLSHTLTDYIWPLNAHYPEIIICAYIKTNQRRETDKIYTKSKRRTIHIKWIKCHCLPHSCEEKFDKVELTCAYPAQHHKRIDFHTHKHTSDINIIFCGNEYRANDITYLLWCKRAFVIYQNCGIMNKHSEVHPVSMVSTNGHCSQSKSQMELFASAKIQLINIFPDILAMCK